MKVVKPAKIPVLTRAVEIGRRLYFHVAGVIAFPLDTPRALSDELSFWKVTAEALGEKGVFDEGFAKSRGELLVCGSFFAPEGKPLPASYVRARVGPIDKRLAVIGDRAWQDGAASAPVPMTTMPIDWAHAFGGPKLDRNPYGKGAEPIEIGGRSVHPLPNVERYGSVMRAPSDRPEPAGFLPMDVTFAQRRARAGTYDKRWIDEYFPGMPPDTDPAFFNVAPEDQWLDRFFQGDEEFLIENMHPERPRIEGRLPGLTLRSFVTHRTPEGERFLEIPLRCDLVWLFPTAGMGAVVFHGAMRIAEDDAADIVHLICACEEPGSSRPIEHYRDTLTRRLDKDKQAIAGLSDSDLMPSRHSGVIPNIGGFDIGRWVRSENLASKNARRGKERMLAEARARIEAQGRDPKEHGVPDLEPEEEPLPLDDLDALAAYMEKQTATATAAAKDMARELGEKESEAKDKARKAFAEMGKDYDQVMAQAEKDSAGPPKFSAAAHLLKIEAMARDARDSGVPLVEVEKQIADPKFRAQLEQQEQGLKDMYRRFGHQQPTAAPMDAETAARVRLLVELALETGESLAGRDFTGADLSGMELAGVDLAGALLEAADLSRCDLSRANLEGAVLAKASLRGADLSGAQLAGANLGGADLENALLERVDLKEGVLHGAKLRGARFIDAELPGTHWMEVELAGVELAGAVLTRALFLKTDLSGVSFAGADLTEATFIECKLDGADFARATLHKTSFLTCTGEGVSFREANLRQAVFVQGSSFPKADFRDAEMEKANLRGTALPGTLFDRANLDGADLSECDAAGASFERATIKGGLMIRTGLSKASLQGANLTDLLASKSRLAGADFTGANLHRTDLSRVVGDAKTTFAEAELAHVRFLPKAEVPQRGEP